MTFKELLIGLEKLNEVSTLNDYSISKTIVYTSLGEIEKYAVQCNGSHLFSASIDQIGEFLLTQIKKEMAQ